MSRSSSVEETLTFLRDAIVSGRFQPGERLDQVDIATELGIDRIAVREALSILAAEGALAYGRNQGYTVPQMSVDILEQVITMRDLLEDELIRNVRRPSAKERKNLQRLNEAALAAARTNQYVPFVRENRAFHLQVFGLADRPMILEMADRLWRLFDPYRAIYVYESHDAERSAAEDTAILEACSAGDIATCLRIYGDRRKRTYDRLRNVLAAQSTGEPATSEG